MVRLRLTASGDDKELLTESLEKHFMTFKEKVKEFLVIDEDLPIEVVVAKLLKEKKNENRTFCGVIIPFICFSFSSSITTLAMTQMKMAPMG